MPRQKNFRALQAFEAVARHRSITAAAAELGVTQSAVSHQIRHLTEDIGEKLIVRSGRHIELSTAGQSLAERLHTAFKQIEQSIDDVVGGRPDVLRLAVCSSFAPGWLISRLSRFYNAHPDIDLELRMYAQDPALTDEVADAFVTSFPKAPGFRAMHLQSEYLVAVRPAVNGMAVPGKLPLVTTCLPPNETPGEDWRQFCAVADLPAVSFLEGPRLRVSHYVLALEMVRQGLGMALVPDFLAQEDINLGKVALFHPAKLPTGEDYYLCIKSSRRSERALRLLELWFKTELTVKNRDINAYMKRVHA